MHNFFDIALNFLLGNKHLYPGLMEFMALLFFVATLGKIFKVLGVEVVLEMKTSSLRGKGREGKEGTNELSLRLNSGTNEGPRGDCGDVAEEVVLRRRIEIWILD